MRSVQQRQKAHSFAQIARAEIQRSMFDRSCGLKTTFDSGFLVPVFCDEALPGDTMSLQMHTYGRLATPLHPFIENIYLDSFFFAVPIRLIWDNWQKFNGEQTDPGDSTSFLVPQQNTGSSGGLAEQSLGDYIGIPTKIEDLDYSTLWHRAYNLIWNEFFRDENLQDSVVVDKDDGPDTVSDYVLLRRGKRHDYFSSCLPFPQKGPAVTLPIGSTAPVVPSGSGAMTVETATDATVRNLINSGTGTDVIMSGAAPGSGPSNLQWITTGMEADLSAATASTINDIREAFQIQRLLERDARGGSRYTEIIRSHFGVVSADQRLQRPEYLGGGSQNVSVTPVPVTTDLGLEVGQLAGYAVTSGSGHTFHKSYTEHCVVIGLVSVRADLNYQQGLQRMFSRRTRFDFFWPALAHLGEQAVLKKEIDARGAGPGSDDLVFGYQERWAEYRYKPSQITGRMRSNATQSLDSWHLAQEFGVAPSLDDAYIQETPPLSRLLAVTSEPEFLLDAYFQFKHARPMPTYSTPGLIDHF